MKFLAAVSIIMGFLTGTLCQLDCTDLGDGVHGWGCRSYTICEGGKGTQVDCTPPNVVFNPETEACDQVSNVAPPCGSRIDCSGLADGRYADLSEECTSFYTCLDGQYLGHNPCIDGLVFDEELSVCNWADQVAPPCGTMLPINSTEGF